MGAWYPEVVEHADEIERVVRAEEERFAETLERGMREFDELAGKEAITGDEAFRLAATFGFPIELTVELAEERGQAVDVDGYRHAMAEHREISRAGEKGDTQRAADFAREAGFRSEFVGWEQTEVLTQLGALEELADGRFLAKLRESPFYPDGGGQVTDAGFIELDGPHGPPPDPARAELEAAYRLDDDQVLVFRGEGFSAGDRVRAVVPWAVRFPTMANHTATHLLHRALQDVLGEHARQAGSAVRPDKLRFDFTHAEALTPEQRHEVERRVNEKVFENQPVRAFITPIEEARKLGAMMLFGEKYGDEVRVVEVDGVLARALRRHPRSLDGGDRAVRDHERGLRRRRHAPDRGRHVGRGVGAAARARARGRRAAGRGAAPEEAGCEGTARRRRRSRRRPRRCATVGGVNLVTNALEGFGADELLDLSDRLKQQHAPAAVVLGSAENGNAHLIFNFDRSLEERGVRADAVIKEAAALIGGGGGGRPTMARAGGKQPEKLPEAIARAEELIVSALS